MKVILAGLPKTGTKSMAMALRQLGYDVYDVTENLTHLGDEWLRIMNEGGGSVEDLRRMYEGVDATCDVPACHYWEELYNAFPKAKVILMMRDNEDVWCKSMANQLDIMANSPIFSWLSHLSHSNRKLHKFLNSSMRVTLGSGPMNGVEKYKPNWQTMKIAYRNHNTRVMQVVAPERLLVFRCRDGWAPLCRFLRLPVPPGELPFPHENKQGALGKPETLHSNPGYLQIRREIARSFALIALVLLMTLALSVFLACRALL